MPKPEENTVPTLRGDFDQVLLLLERIREVHMDGVIDPVACVGEGMVAAAQVAIEGAMDLINIQALDLRRPTRKQATLRRPRS